MWDQTLSCNSVCSRSSCERWYKSGIGKKEMLAGNKTFVLCLRWKDKVALGVGMWEGGCLFISMTVFHFSIPNDASPIFFQCHWFSLFTLQPSAKTTVYVHKTNVKRINAKVFFDAQNQRCHILAWFGSFFFFIPDSSGAASHNLLSPKLYTCPGNRVFSPVFTTSHINTSLFSFLLRLMFCFFCFLHRTTAPFNLAATFHFSGVTYEWCPFIF